MGADLLLAILPHNKNKKLDWAAGRRAARKLDARRVEAGVIEAYGEFSGLTEARKQVNGMISDLRAEITDASARDAICLEVGAWRIHVRGGTSWGDDPSYGWTAISNMLAFPEVLKAIGFNLDAVKW